MTKLDSSGLIRVAKHHTVIQAHRRGRVVKLCNGSALVLWEGDAFPLPEYCQDLTVVVRSKRNSRLQTLGGHM